MRLLGEGEAKRIVVVAAAEAEKVTAENRTTRFRNPG
jgi:hypothetical protein